MEDIAELQERTVSVKRVAKVVKGGRRFGFSVIVVVGNGRGMVGAGLGKANEVPEAIAKATDQAKKNMFQVPLTDGRTIPHEVLGDFGAGKVLMKPASPGTGVIAGGALRALVEVSGIQDILAKCLSTSNPYALIHAGVVALKKLRSPEEVARLRRKSVESVRS